MITDSRLKTFVAVVECGSFTGASHSLRLSQPTVSQHVAQLEEESGGPLLVRERGGVALTEKGARFLGIARRILALYERLDAEMSGAPVTADEPLSLDLGDGRSAEVSALSGKLLIDIKGK